jgi:hypothetical protein
MQAGEMQHEEKMAKLSSLLRLDEQGNAQAFQTAFQQMQNDFTLYRDELGYDRETATRLAQEAFQERMQQAGFNQETAVQATQLAHQVSEGQKNRASQEMMAAASLAQQDSQFMAELEQRYQFNAQDLDLRKQELGAQLQLMGLQGKQLEAALANDKIQNAMQIAALGMEIGDGSEAAMAPFVEQLGKALEGYMTEQGIDITGGEFAKALTQKAAPAEGSARAQSQDFGDYVNQTLGTLDPGAALEFTEEVLSTKALTANLSATQRSELPNAFPDEWLVQGVRRLESLGIPKSAISAQLRRNEQGTGLGETTHYTLSATQPGADYAIYAHLLSGMSEPNAK